MSKQHNHDHGDNSDLKNLGMAFFLNLFFALFELIGGLFTNSLAILSDALHDLGDSVSLGLAWYFQRKSKKAANLKFTYGYKRFSLLGVIINSVILIIGAFFIIKAAIPRFTHVTEPNAQGMMVIALVGLVVNGFAVWKLRQGASKNEKVISIHMMEDVLGWLAVLIGSIVMYFTNWFWIDPLLSILIAIYVLTHVYGHIKSAMEIILQARPDNVSIEKIRTHLKDIPGVIDIHDLHVWSLDGEKNVMTAHIVISDNVSQHGQFNIKKEVKDKLAQLHVDHVTLELELQGECLGQPCDFTKV